MEGTAEGHGVLGGRYELGRVLGRVLGRGSFAKVHVARDLRSGRAVAMKVVRKERVMRAGTMEQVKREISVMKMVSHPNIVELHEVLATRTRIYLAMELVKGGELFARVARGGRLREDAARRYFRQLISAVDFCHSRGVYHRDLKLQNLLLDQRCELKVADFGLSAFADSLGSDGLLHTTCGTPAYIAPEVVSKKGYDGSKADLWSCGVILYALLAGFLPFNDDNLVLMYKKMRRGEFRCPPWFSADARRVIVRLLDPNPASRITIAQLTETPWFNKCPVPRMALSSAHVEEEENPGKKDEPERLNAFHLISLSEGLNLSPLFEDGGRREEGMRFATRELAAGVISRLEGVAAKTAGGMRVTKCSVAGVRLEGEQKGRKGQLVVAVEILTVAPSVLVVEVKKDGGDSLEYRRFCSDELRPALKDIVWTSSGDGQPAAAAWLSCSGH